MVIFLAGSITTNNWSLRNLMRDKVMTNEEIVTWATYAMNKAIDEFWKIVFEEIGDDAYKEFDLNPISITIGDKSYVI